MPKKSIMNKNLIIIVRKKSHFHWLSCHVKKGTPLPWVGEVRKMAIFADLHIYGWVGLKNPEHADVILEWSLVSLFFWRHCLFIWLLTSHQIVELQLKGHEITLLIAKLVCLTTKIVLASDFINVGHDFEKQFR